MGTLSRFGSNPGSLVEVDLIADTLIGQNNQAQIMDFGGSAGPGSVDTLIKCELSNDGAVWVEVDRIELPAPGTGQLSYSSKVRVTAGQHIRVRGVQGTAGPMSGKLRGETTGDDIADI